VTHLKGGRPKKNTRMVAKGHKVKAKATTRGPSNDRAKPKPPQLAFVGVGTGEKKKALTKKREEKRRDGDQATRTQQNEGRWGAKKSKGGRSAPFSTGKNEREKRNPLGCPSAKKSGGKSKTVP